MKHLAILLTTLLMSTTLMAQSQAASTSSAAERMQQLTQLTNHYIQVFALSAKDANSFRTIFYEYNKQLQAIKRQNAPAKTNGVPTDADLDATIRARFARQRAILDVRMTYYERMRTVLSPSQIQRIYEDEKNRMDKLKK